jgi:hypothetical protein
MEIVLKPHRSDLLPQWKFFVFLTRGLYLASRETRVETFLRIASAAISTEIVEFLAVIGSFYIVCFHRDERLVFCKWRSDIEPGVSHLFVSDFRVGEVFVEVPSLLVTHYAVLQRVDDFADFTTARMTMTNSCYSFFSEFCFFQGESSFSCYFFLNTARYLSDSSSHQTLLSLNLDWIFAMSTMHEGRKGFYIYIFVFEGMGISRFQTRCR